MGNHTGRKALFLDRDGVINKEKHYLFKIKDFEFINGIFETCKYFQDSGYLIMIITNQSGIARKLYGKKDFHILNTWMLQEFCNRGININKVYHCPHHPDFTGRCKCRKPEPGMILQAEKEFDIDLSRSILVGDKKSDIKAGMAAGIKKNYYFNSKHEINNTAFQLNMNILKNLKDLKTEI